MKKFFLRLIMSVILCSAGFVVNAETMQVMSLSDFSTENPSEFIELRLYDDFKLDEILDLPCGYEVKARVVDITTPKRLKRNASFYIIPVSYRDLNGKEFVIEDEIKGKFSPKFNIDKVDVVKSAALTVGNHFVKGISAGYYAIEGAVKNQEGNRFKSGVVSLYEKSPLSYINNGNELEIKKGDCFSFKFKAQDADEESEN